jgi:hypothetical protein
MGKVTTLLDDQFLITATGSAPAVAINNVVFEPQAPEGNSGSAFAALDGLMSSAAPSDQLQQQVSDLQARVQNLTMDNRSDSLLVQENASDEALDELECNNVNLLATACNVVPETMVAVLDRQEQQVSTNAVNGRNMNCFICGSPDHFARNCTGKALQGNRSGRQQDERSTRVLRGAGGRVRGPQNQGQNQRRFSDIVMPRNSFRRTGARGMSQPPKRYAMYGKSRAPNGRAQLHAISTRADVESLPNEAEICVAEAGLQTITEPDLWDFDLA